MCDFVYFSDEVLEQMKEVYPKNVDERHFSTFKEFVKQHIMKTKDEHYIKKANVKGLNGQHDIIYGTFGDALAVVPEFISVF